MELNKLQKHRISEKLDLLWQLDKIIIRDILDGRTKKDVNLTLYRALLKLEEVIDIIDKFK